MRYEISDGLMTLIRVASELRDCILALAEVCQDHRLEHVPGCSKYCGQRDESADTPAVIRIANLDNEQALLGDIHR